jgi:hypothetical protein
MSVIKLFLAGNTSGISVFPGFFYFLSEKALLGQRYSLPISV